MYLDMSFACHLLHRSVYRIVCPYECNERELVVRHEVVKRSRPAFGGRLQRIGAPISSWQADLNHRLSASRRDLLHPPPRLPCRLFYMFSQWRNVVEGIAGPQQVRQSSQERPSGDSFDPVPRSRSLDGTALLESLSSTTHLADSALNNLRKSLTSQRTGLPAPASSHAASPPSDRPSKARLEDRLRASFAIGEASNATTPTNASSRASPSPVPVTEHPLSPTTEEPPSKVDAHAVPHETLTNELATDEASVALPSPSLVASPEEGAWHAEADIPLPASPPPVDTSDGLVPFQDVSNPMTALMGKDTAVIEDTSSLPLNGTASLSEPLEDTGAERTTVESKPDQCPLSDHMSTESHIIRETIEDSDPGISEPALAAPATNSSDVDALQERLKLIEQRFSGMTPRRHRR